VTLSWLLRARGVTRVELLKVDVEGDEEDVLRSLEPALWPCIMQVLSVGEGSPTTRPPPPARAVWLTLTHPSHATCFCRRHVCLPHPSRVLCVRTCGGFGVAGRWWSRSTTQEAAWRGYWPC
jgi:hypothetical protein